MIDVIPQSASSGVRMVAKKSPNPQKKSDELISSRVYFTKKMKNSDLTLSVWLDFWINCLEDLNLKC